MIIAALGDSITKGVFVEEQCYLNRLSEITGAETINAGVPGQTSSQGLNRLQAEVLDRRPDVCIVAFGMNDHVCTAEDTPKTSLTQFADNLRTICGRLKAARIVPILCTVHPIIEGNEREYYYARHPQEWYRKPNGAQAWIDLYNEAIRDVAHSENVALADVAKYWREKLADGLRMDDLLLTTENFGKDDGVHLTAAGHELYASCIAGKLP